MLAREQEAAEKQRILDQDPEQQQVDSHGATVTQAPGPRGVMGPNQEHWCDSRSLIGFLTSEVGGFGLNAEARSGINPVTHSEWFHRLASAELSSVHTFGFGRLLCRDVQGSEAVILSLLLLFISSSAEMKEELKEVKSRSRSVSGLGEETQLRRSSDTIREEILE
ncbi:unnamed protein product [Pleuronectes platessa]|uniref:Uncharacterized protein n=1 Tax=Pleuronectes platessa TaxID=8262 RepID=A0A9N7VIW1_PLEPL|nr:unnamed protein product [Pleuronectes platessa]